MKLPRSIAIATALGGTLLACGPSGHAAPSVRAGYGESFVLALGETAEVGDAYRVRFDRVSEDSRCPADARCVQAGNAAAAFGVESERGSATLTLHTDRAPRSAAAMGGELTLMDLAPLPATGVEPDSADYRATVIVRPAP